MPRLRVGLTGGIGSGKSTVSAMLADRGAMVIDADMLAREVVARDTPGLAEVVDAFGHDLLTASGDLDRVALGKRVFADPSARAELEAIIHPRVRARAAQIEAAAGADAVVVHDIPLLVETCQQDDFDAVIVVDAPHDVQVERLTAGRGMTEAEAETRIAAQASRERRRAAADHVVINDGSFDALRRRVDAVWDELVGERIG
jgi:dephospho-CoA kinase